MIVYTKKYKGDALKAYKILMRKLNKEGFYQELKSKQYFKTTGQKRKEQTAKGKAREKKRKLLKEKQLERAEYSFKTKKVKQP